MDSELIAWRVEAGRFADVQLMAELQRVARVDRRCEARILVLLAEVEVRELYLAQGYSSLFGYAVSVLRMSDAQACFRIGAARVARRYPVALEMLVEGALSLSTIKLLAPKLTAENHAQLLERARGMTKQEVEHLIAEIAPKPDVPTRLRKLPARGPRTRSAQAELVPSPPPVAQQTNVAADIARALLVPQFTTPQAATASAPAAVTAPSVVSAPAAATAPSVATAPSAVTAPAVVATLVETAAVTPHAAASFVLEAPRASCSVLSPGRFKLELTVDQAVFDQMMALKHMLKHRVPSGDLGVILARAITELSEKVRKQRFAELSKPASGARAQASRNEVLETPSVRAPRGHLSTRASHNDALTAAAGPSHRGGGAEHGPDKTKRRSRYVPRAVVRDVFARDGGQCTFVGVNGQRCTERAMLELDHVNAFALGGSQTPDNLRVVCRAHNGHFATLAFGAAHMRTKRTQARSQLA
jgi:hypothetical protein